MTHVPCSHCGSSDAGWLRPDGSVFCYVCSTNDTSGMTGDVPSQRSNKRTRMLKMIDVDVSPLPKRGITLETCEKYKYGYGEFKGERVQVAQYYNKSGALVAQKIRTADKKFTVLGDLKEAVLFGQQLWRDGGKSLTITEGEIDALSVSQVMENKWPVVSVPTGSGGAVGAIKKNLEWISGFDRVVFMFDMDEPGREAALECAQLLPPGKAFIAQLPLKDANEMIKEGRRKELLDAFWSAKVYRPDGLVTGDAIWDQIMRSDLARGVEFPWAGLQEKIRNMRVGETTTFVAGTGAGKSTIVRELGAHLMERDEKVGYIALEENVRRSALGMLSIQVNRPLHFCTNAEIDQMADVHAAMARIKDKIVFYDHFGSTGADNLLAKMRFMARGEGCTFIILDHLSIVVSGMDLNEDERRAIDNVMTAITTLGQEANVGILLVCHLKKPGQGDSHEEGRQISLDDLRGSGSIKQLSFNVIAAERNQQAEGEAKNTIQLRVLKCRHTGDTGEAGELVYDKETGRLREISPFGAAEVSASGGNMEATEL